MSASKALENLFLAEQACLSAEASAECRKKALQLITEIEFPTKQDYFHIAFILQQGSNEELQKAHDYAEKSVRLGLFQHPNLGNNQNLHATIKKKIEVKQKVSDEDEARCSNCGGVGHTWVTCVKPPNFPRPL